MRIALAQLRNVLGDFEGNFQQVQFAVEQAQEAQVDFLVFPELFILGYPPLDLLERPELAKLQNQYLRKVQSILPKKMGVLIGAIQESPKRQGKPYFNCALFFEKGKKPKVFAKELLPAYDIFNEGRFFESGLLAKNILKFRGQKILISICEDMWGWPQTKYAHHYKNYSGSRLRPKDVDLVVNLSASPYYVGKRKERYETAAAMARALRAPLVYVNTVGAQDEVIFDGSSFVLNSKGEPQVLMNSFVEDFYVWDSEQKLSNKVKFARESEEDLWSALVLGLKEFVLRTGFKKVHLGLSGGIDSALVAALAADALGPENLHLIAMPGPHSSPLSLELAQEMANLLGSSLQAIDFVEQYENLNTLLIEHFKINEFGLPQENLQARIRGLILMAFSNATGSLLLTTGNKSEFATGYSTLYGDLCGGLAVIGDLLKRQVYALARWRNRQGLVIPVGIIDRAPSAELKPNQRDSDSLPPYEKLDDSVQRIVEKMAPLKTPTDHFLMQKLIRSEFKRAQAPPVLKVSSHSFGSGRLWPIAHRAFREPESKIS